MTSLHTLTNTRVWVTVSHVSYLSGLRLDIDPIARAAHAHGALLLADVTQSLGVVPVDVSECDFAVASTYKWLLGVHGSGVLYWNRARLPEFAPGAVGWFSVDNFISPDRFERFTWKPTAERFELGMPGACGNLRLGERRTLPPTVWPRPHRRARGSAR